MKKILTILLATIAISTASNAQTKETPKHRAFVSASGNWQPGYNPSYSFEAGSWGMTSPTTYSAVVDVVPNYFNGGQTKVFVGAKAYWTIGAPGKMCYMFYVAPKVQADSLKNGLIEFGFNPYYTLSNDLLLGVAVGNQTYDSSPWNIFGSLGIVYLFRNK